MIGVEERRIESLFPRGELIDLGGRRFDDPLLRDTVYGHPDSRIPVDPYLQDNVMDLTRYSEGAVEKALLKKGLRFNPPEYAAAADLFYPHFQRLTMLGPRFIEMYKFPIGHIGAAYDEEKDAVLIDTGSIPGTEKNEWLRGVYEHGEKTLNKMISKYPFLEEYLDGSRQFCRNMAEKLKQKPWYEILHEYWHSVISKIGLSKYLSREENEGLTENLTQRSGGKPNLLETTYSVYREGMRKVLDCLNIGPTLDVVSRAVKDHGYEIGRKISKKYRSIMGQYSPKNR